MKCKSCGKDIRQNVCYCENCGAKVDSSSDSSSESSSRVPSNSEATNKAAEGIAAAACSLGKRMEEAKDALKEAKKAAEAATVGTRSKTYEAGKVVSKEKGKQRYVLIAATVFVILFVCISLIAGFVSSKQSSSPSTPSSASQVLEKEPVYSLKMNVKCNENLFFSKYGFEVYVDSIKIGHVDHGSSNEFTEELKAGEHKLELKKADNSKVCGTRNFTLEAEDSTLSCTASCEDDQITIKDFTVKTKTQAKQDEEAAAREVASNQKGEDRQEVPPKIEASQNQAMEESENEIYNEENCEDLREILSMQASGADAYASFASKYKGDEIEFDGYISYWSNHGTFKTRFDFLLSPGNYGDSPILGPNFKFDDVNRSDLGLPSNVDGLNAGDNVHVVAKVVKYDALQELFYLDPVSVNIR